MKYEIDGASLKHQSYICTSGRTTSTTKN